MNCKEINELIHGYLDGELDLVRSLEIEKHLKECRVCAEAYQEQQTLHSIMTQNMLYFDAPKSLRKNIRLAIREAHRTEAPQSVWGWHWYRLWVPLGAVILLLLVAVPLLMWKPAEAEPVPQQLLAAQIRSLMPGHLLDIPSSDNHTVKSWFNGKLDFSPPVIDLTADGFPLAGGRLDYVDNRPVAVLVYRRNRHCINLFMWPRQKAQPSAEKLLTRQGYNMIHWTESGMNCWAVSDLNKTNLQQYVRLLRSPEYNYGPSEPTGGSTTSRW